MLSIAFKAKVFKMGNRVAIDLTLSVVNRQLEADLHSSFRFDKLKFDNNRAAPWLALA